MTPRPVCAMCSRNARTVETPRVKVRVDSSRVYRDAAGDLQLIARCHGATEGPTRLMGEWIERLDEAAIEELEVFRGG